MSENFNINNSIENKKEEFTNKAGNIGELNMSVSAICSNKEGKKYAYVTFSDGIRNAEGVIPECTINKNKGFADIEIQQLEKYMKENLAQLKKMAAGVDVFSAFLASDK
ncbi:hypothetical protein SAMN02910384_02797 [Pseudobutyrivibrio sp. ACV-2]|uniref:hypothetical protein n=1 Tax=Pseudobutyrivibrio sp. ACV-2 TaxID=1520801 RepID=UPI00089ACE36|nr:hypothetical protein [Pseudobutyrivibrio sp. ACV-2]SEA93911.1 hypothetical protein SAMN02910384_02797 [Pseudobutyrivibrio sp. ACV-2]